MESWATNLPVTGLGGWPTFAGVGTMIAEAAPAYAIFEARDSSPGRWYLGPPIRIFRLQYRRQQSTWITNSPGNLARIKT